MQKLFHHQKKVNGEFSLIKYHSDFKSSFPGRGVRWVKAEKLKSQDAFAEDAFAENAMTSEDWLRHPRKVEEA